MESRGETDWQIANASADLGLSVPPGTHLRFLKRLIARFCGPFLRPQVAYNHALLGELVTIRNDLVAQIQDARRITASAEAQLQALNDVTGGPPRILQLEDLVRRHSWGIDAALPVLEQQQFLVEALKETVETLELDRNLVHQEVELAQQQSFAHVQDGLGSMRAEMTQLSRSLDERLGTVGGTGGIMTEMRALRMRLTQVDLVLDRFRRSVPELPTADELSSLPSLFDGIYASFEEVMRGSSETIRERVAEHLPDLLPAKGIGPLLDIGCGRGELLDVMTEAGIASYGIETNPVYVEMCTARGLDVRAIDLRDHLASLPDLSLGAITAIQVVEHISTDDLIRLLSEAVRVLGHGGLLLLETPNPDNLTVGASTFYLDPTHHNPIPPPLLEFLVGSCGFTDVEVRYRRTKELIDLPKPQPASPWSADLEPVLDAVNARFFGAQDYAVLAKRI